MFLKSLTLKGFKSFADTTSLDLEPGITVVVGPNGSGKSNIVDAVAWVLGAQGPRTVRSSKMEDVIFAGTAKRPALGRAEVSLTIDNSAGVLDIGFSEVTITRTLFRSGDSEYAINGVPCRLLDVQELLSDSGVGRQQHVIVSQGNLDAVLNSRPEERRLIIEEAAGVLKYRRRREKAQRRLDATEANFLRLQDLLREVRRQLRPLERQAEAARRHGAVVEELQALRLHLAGREIATLRARSESSARSKTELAAAESQLRQTLARLDTDVMTAEAAISARGVDDVSDALLRYESLRERAKGLANLLAERQRSVEAAMRVAADEGVIASLESEAARLAAELAQVETEAEGLMPRADELAQAEAAFAAEREAYATEHAAPEEGERLQGTGAAEVRGELGALRTSLERGQAEVDRVSSRLAGLAQKGERLAAEAETARAAIAQADEAEAPLVQAAEAAESRRAAAENEAADGENALRAVEGEWRSWTARADALALALDEARSRAGAERLADVEGVVGTLLDLVDVDAGWEEAFEAALGEALSAVVVADVDAARRALTHLHEGGTPGAVLAVEAPGQPPTLPFGLAGESVRSHVRGTTAAVEHLLDRVLAGAVAIDGAWHDALDVALANPELVVVTRSGDRFGVSGWRSGVAGTGATGAALEEARRRAEEGAALVAAASERLASAKAELGEARRAEAELSKALDENDARMTGATATLQRVETELHDVTVEEDSQKAHLAELHERVERESARVRELETLLPSLEAEEEAAKHRQLAERAARGRLEERAAALAALRRDLEVRAAAIEERRGFLTTRLADTEERLRRNVAEREQAAIRRVALEKVATATRRLAAVVTERLAVADDGLGRLREQRRRQSEELRERTERLENLRRERQNAERQLTETRERAQRIELEEAEVRVRLEQAVETLRRDYDVEPEAAIGVECPPLNEGVSAPARVRELERELRLMGPINPLALEEYTALQERHEFLEGQLEDVKSTRRELSKVIRAIDGEIVETFAAAFADVSENFVALFQTLFPGGTGRLKLTDPDNLLETGIELEARPSGKNVRQLSLLSGGERSLTAMAFLFAVFRSRPSPFYLMDEVEAALDDVNLHRFLDLVDEFRREAQLLIVSHQKRTMEAADVLYGVTMQPGGSSRVISEKVAAGA